MTARPHFYFRPVVGWGLTAGWPYLPTMWTRPVEPEERPDRVAVRWLRVLKLVLTVILLAVAVWDALAGAV